LSGCVDRKLSGCVNRKLSGCVDRKLSGCVDRNLSGCVDRKLSGCVDRKLSGCVDTKLSGCVDRKFSGCVDRKLSGCVGSQMFKNDVVFIFVVVFQKWTCRTDEEFYFISLQFYTDLCRTHSEHCKDNLGQCFSTAGPRPGTWPWYQLYRAARGSTGSCHFSFLSIFHE
jgi:hypothetical protein